MGDVQVLGSILEKLDEVVPVAKTLLNSTSSAYEASRQVKQANGVLYGLSGYNSKGSAQFIQVHDATTLPAAGAVPKVVVAVAAQANFSVDFGASGRQFNVGILVCNSSTGPTLTVGSADCWLDVQYL